MCIRLDEILYNQPYMALSRQNCNQCSSLENLKSKPLKDPSTYLLIRTLYPMNDICLRMKGVFFSIQRGTFILLTWMRAIHETSVLYKEHKQAHPFCSKSERAVHVDMHPCTHARMHAWHSRGHS